MEAFHKDKVNLQQLHASLTSLQNTMAALYHRGNPSSISFQDPNFGFNVGKIMANYQNMEEKLQNLTRHMTSDQSNEYGIGEVIYPSRLDTSGNLFHRLPQYLESGSLGKMMTEEKEILSRIREKISYMQENNQSIERIDNRNPLYNSGKKRKRNDRSEKNMNAMDVLTSDDEDDNEEQNRGLNSKTRLISTKEDLSDERIRSCVTEVNNKLENIIKKYKLKVQERKENRSTSQLPGMTKQEERRIKMESEKHKETKSLQLQNMCQSLFCGEK